MGVGGQLIDSATSLPVGKSAPTTRTYVGINGQTYDNSTGAVIPPAKSPTAVVSTRPAVDNVNSVIKPALIAGQTAIADQNQQREDLANNPPKPIVTLPVVTPPEKKTPEEQVASDGNQDVYDQNGNKVASQPTGATLPAGYSFTNPKQAPNLPVSSSASTNTGTFVQYSNGTYGRFDATGQYAGTASSADYEVAKDYQTAKSAYNSILNGSYPLSPIQQAQIEALKASADKQIAVQDTINKNVMGGLATYLNLHGLAGDTVGIAQIAQNATAGAQRIGDIQSKLALDVANMTEADTKDNLAMLKGAYDSFTQNARDMQNAIDDVQAKHDDAVKQFQTLQQKDKDAVNAVLLEATKNGASPKTIEAIKASTNEADALQAAGNSIQQMTGAFAGYPVYRQTMEARGLTPLDPISWKDQEDKKAEDLKASESYRNAFNAEAGRSDAVIAGYGDSKKQDSYEKTYTASLQGALKGRSSPASQEEQRIMQGNRLSALFASAYDPKTGNYNINSSMYEALAYGMASLISKTGNPQKEVIDGIRTATAKGDFSKLGTYLTGTPLNGSTQDMFNQLGNQIDTETQTAVSNRDAELGQIKAQYPTGLDPARKARIDAAVGTTYNPINGPDKQVLDYVKNHPDQATGLSELSKQPGMTPEKIILMLQAAGKM